MDHVHNPLVAHVILGICQVVITCFLGFLTYRGKRAREDREAKFREMTLLLEHHTERIVRHVDDCHPLNQPHP